MVVFLASTLLIFAFFAFVGALAWVTSRTYTEALITCVKVFAVFATSLAFIVLLFLLLSSVFRSLGLS